MSENLTKILTAAQIGEISPQQAIAKLQALYLSGNISGNISGKQSGNNSASFEVVGDFAKIDHQRTARTGFPEVVFGLGKTPAQIAAIMKSMYAETGQAVSTKISPPIFNQIQSLLADPEYLSLQYSELAQICYLGLPPASQAGKITVVSAGTADLPIAEEAALTAELCGYEVVRLWDVGVAGIQRLWQNQHLLVAADVLIVVAGMEGALPSVVAGLVSCPVIAVPTSIGYGANFGGVAALLTMLNSCATGIGVVNIDNGFGAAILAGKILKTANKLNEELTE